MGPRAHIALASIALAACSSRRDPPPIVKNMPIREPIEPVVPVQNPDSAGFPPTDPPIAANERLTLERIALPDVGTTAGSMSPWDPLEVLALGHGPISERQHAVVYVEDVLRRWTRAVEASPNRVALRTELRRLELACAEEFPQLDASYDRCVRESHPNPYVFGKRLGLAIMSSGEGRFDETGRVVVAQLVPSTRFDIGADEGAMAAYAIRMPTVDPITASDADGDGHFEVVVTARWNEADEEHGTQSARAYTFVVDATTLLVQAVIVRLDEYAERLEDSLADGLRHTVRDGEATVHSFADENGDGRADLVLRTAAFTGHCAHDRGLPVATPTCNVSREERIVCPYVADRDAWSCAADATNVRDAVALPSPRIESGPRPE